MTAAELLESVEAAITAVTTTGQRYKLRNGMEVERGDLSTLETMRKTLKAEVAGADSTQGLYRRVGFRSAN